VNGIERLVLLTTRTADWFEQRDFKLCGECGRATTLVLPPADDLLSPVKDLLQRERCHVAGQGAVGKGGVFFILGLLSPVLTLAQEWQCCIVSSVCCLTVRAAQP